MRYVRKENMEEIKSIIEEYAKYQKVMLLYDDTVSNAEIMDIYNTIKGLCIYNHANISQYDPLELNNGYKLLIIKANADNVLRLKVDYDEFVTIFIPTDRTILPYLLNHNNKINTQDNIVIQKNNIVDNNIDVSIYVNQFLHYFHSLYTLVEEENMIDLNDYVDTNIISKIENLSPNMEYVDIKILKESNIEYRHLYLVDLILINAFLVLISSVRNKSLELVDIYKSSKEEIRLIDKFFAMTYDKSFIDIINLNYNSLYNICNKTKSKILPLIDMFNIDHSIINEIVGKVKLYIKNTDDRILSYLYLYNIFGI